MTRMVIGVFDDYGVTGKAVDELGRAGFEHEQISMLCPSQKSPPDPPAEVHSEHVPEELAKFTAAGAIGGGLIGLAALTVPGVGPVLAGGPLLAALSGAAAGSYVGFLAGVLTRMDIDEAMAAEYESLLAQGHILLGVNINNEEEEHDALQVLDAAGAMNIHERIVQAAA